MRVREKAASESMPKKRRRPRRSWQDNKFGTYVKHSDIRFRWAVRDAEARSPDFGRHPLNAIEHARTERGMFFQATPTLRELILFFFWIKRHSTHSRRHERMRPDRDGTDCDHS